MQDTRGNEGSFAAVADESLGQLQRPAAHEAGAARCLGKMVELPSIGEIEDAPETALLSVLQYALGVAAVSLAAEHGAIGRMSECYEGRVPGRHEMLAQQIVDGCTWLSEQIHWYRRICQRRGLRHWPESSDEQMPL